MSGLRQAVEKQPLASFRVVLGDGVGGMAAVGTETVPSEWCQVVGWVRVAAVGTETVSSEWCQMIGGGGGGVAAVGTETVGGGGG